MSQVKVSVTQSCLILCDPTDCSPPGSSVHGVSPDKNTGVGLHALLQGIFPTQGSNPGLSHCRQSLYHLSPREAQEYWSGQPIPSAGELPKPRIEPGFPALQAKSLPAEPPGKPPIVYRLLELLMNFNSFILFQVVFDQ